MKYRIKFQNNAICVQKRFWFIWLDEQYGSAGREAIVVGGNPMTFEDLAEAEGYIDGELEKYKAYPCTYINYP